MKLSTRGIIGLISCGICISPALSAEAGWSLTQNARGGTTLSGGTTLYITSTGMRATNSQKGISLMTRGPNWTVYIFNDKTKQLFSSPLQPWLESFKQRHLVGRFEGATWKRGNQNGSIANARACEFVMDKPPPVRTSSRALNGKLKNYGTLQTASLWVASDIPTPPEISNIICKIYGVPDCQRIPLRVVLTEFGKGKSTVVDTTKIIHITVPDTAFAVPTGYQVAKTETDVFIDKESMDTLNELIQDLDSPAPPKRRPGQPPQR